MAAHARATTSGIFDAQRSCVFGNVRCRGVASFGGGCVAAAGRRVDDGTGKLLNLRVDVVDNAWDPSSAVAGVRVIMSGIEALSILVMVFPRKLCSSEVQSKIARSVLTSVWPSLHSTEESAWNDRHEGINGSFGEEYGAEVFKGLGNPYIGCNVWDKPLHNGGLV